MHKNQLDCEDFISSSPKRMLVNFIKKLNVIFVTRLTI